MDWDALARAVIARRIELGYPTRNAFIAASRISARTMGDIETGRRDSYAPDTVVRLERALRWASGSADRILAGQPPIEDPDAPLVVDAPEGMDPIAAELVYVLSPDSPVDEDEKETLRMILDQLLRRARMQIRSAQRQAGQDDGEQ